MNRDIAILLAIAGAATVAAVAFAQAEKHAVAGEIKKARDELFDVSPNCESITFKGGGGAPDPGRLELAGQYYFRPFLRSELSAGMDKGEAPGAVVDAEADLMEITPLELLTGRMLYQLFPECAQRDPMPWPPESLFSTFGAIWIAMKLYMSEQIDLVMAELGKA